MKKIDYNQFIDSLNLNIEIDNALRRISEKIKLLSHLREIEPLTFVLPKLTDVNFDIDRIIEDFCNDTDEHEK